MNRDKMFYDSLRARAYKYSLTKNLYDWLIKEDTPGPKKQLRIKSHNYYAPYQGKIIRKISFKQLDVFGPSVEDTTSVKKSKIEDTANLFHTTTSEKYLNKNILFKVGDRIDPILMAENEKLIRDLSFIKDVRFLVTPDENFKDYVNVTVVTKDVFSLGFNVEVKNENSGSFELYNRNTWGRGHTLSGSMVINTKYSPSLGGKAFYGKKNINGSFIDLSALYENTWRKHTAVLDVSKDFLSSETQTAGGFSINRSFKYNTISEIYSFKYDSTLNFSIVNTWLGRNIRLNKQNKYSNNLYLSAGYYNIQFYDITSHTEKKIFYDRDLYLGSITLAKQEFVKTNLVYRYGITEDIPYGYKSELVFGYENGSQRDRWYGHLNLSSGSIFKDNNSYFSATATIGGFLNRKNIEQGIIAGSINYFSPFHIFLGNTVRNFVELKYTLGINRLENEILTLNNFPSGIRGFDSDTVYGLQRISANIESVMFLRREFLRFKLAAYTFTDLGAIGSNKEVIFNQNLYAGIGTGFRLRNESLVFNTLELRIGYYPNPPVDMSKWNIKVATRIDKKFTNFKGQKPRILFFE